jgi:ABC-2 type transport system ATP-binding protein
MGYLPENPSLGDAWTVREFLGISAELAGMRGADARAEITGLVERLGLGHLVDRRLGKMSKGQTQLVGLAHAILGRPSLLVLDEPMSGLDPMARKVVRDTLLELRASGRSIFFSSHILADVELICDRVGLLAEGRLVGIHALDAVHAAGSRSLEVVLTGIEADRLGTSGAEVSDVRAAGSGRVVCRIDAPDRVNDVLETLMQLGATIRSVTPRGATLEEFVLARIGPTGAGTSFASEEPEMPGATVGARRAS